MPVSGLTRAATILFDKSGSSSRASSPDMSCVGKTGPSVGEERGGQESF